MEKIVKFADRQKVTLDDLNNIGGDAREGMDHVVMDAVTGTAARYSGGQVTVTGTTKVSVASPVRLLRAGVVYGGTSDNGTEVDLLGQLPAAGFKRIVAITLTGSSMDDETEERDFLTNASTRETQAQPTSTRNIRVAQVNVIPGAEAVAPIAPAIPVEHLAIAYVVLTPTTIESIQQLDNNRLKTIVDLDGRVILIEAWKAQTQPIIDGLVSDVAGLKNSQNGNQSRGMTVYLLEQVARLTDKLGVDESASFANTDWFLDQAESQVNDPQFVALVEEGLRLAIANSETSSPVLSNPLDTKFSVSADGLLLPAYSNISLVSNVGKDSELALSNSGAQNVTLVQRTVSKTRVRWGATLTVCTNSMMWQSGRYDPITQIFTAAGGETYNVLDPAAALINHQMIRLEQFWVDTYDETYWDVVTTTAAYTGNVFAQTFLMPRAAWITKLNLGFSRLDTQGDVRVAICEVTASGAPDPKNALAIVNVTVDKLKLYPTLTEIAIPPVYATAGTRLAAVLITGGNHWLAMAENNKYAQGTSFISTDSAWFQGDISRDACFEVYAASFVSPRVVIDLDPWSCNGGMSDIDMMLTEVTPEPTDIVFEVKVNNVWYPIAAPVGGATHPLTGLPASVSARMTMIGTTEVMPGIYLNKTKVTRSRPRTDSTHISTTRIAPANVTEVQIIATLEDFDAAHHTCAAKLLTGGDFSTEISPSSTHDDVMPDGSIKRTFVWTSLTPLTQWRRKIVLGSDSALRPFHVAVLTDVAMP